MKRILFALFAVLFVHFMAVFLYVRATTYEDYQRAYRSKPLANWVNNQILVDDDGITHVPFVHHVCTVSDLLARDKKSPLPHCYVVGTTVPLNKCRFWWLAGDCVGLYASRDVLVDPDLRKAIIAAVKDGCIKNDFKAIDLGYLCRPGGELSYEIFLKSVNNNKLEQIEYVIH